MPEEETKPRCFVVMPITTPPERLSDYGDNADHFTDVLETLFIPAIEAAGYEPVPPQFEGSPVIQAAIIRNLLDADLVLCDMSALNPNAMFELGVRSALNKPVAMVRDEVTPKIPFDLGPVSALTYDSTLYGKHLDKGREVLAAHLTATAKVGDHNELWRYFGIRDVGSEPPRGSEMERIEAMFSQLLGRQRSAEAPTPVIFTPAPGPVWKTMTHQLTVAAHISEAMQELAKLEGIRWIDPKEDPPSVEVRVDADLLPDERSVLLARIRVVAEHYNDVEFVVV